MTIKVVCGHQSKKTRLNTLEFRFGLATMGKDWAVKTFGTLTDEKLRNIYKEVEAHGPDAYLKADGTIATEEAHRMFSEPAKFERARNVFAATCVAIHAWIELMTKPQIIKWF